MLALTSEQSREADRRAEDGGLPAAVLRENAGRGAFEILKKYFPDLSQKKILVVCGKGNNGGDGRVVARLLEGVAGEVRVIDVGAWRAMPLHEYDILIDAIFGTGLSRPVEGVAKEAIEAMNRSGKWKMALDVPSGLSADTGEPLGALPKGTTGVAVKADVTVTMGRPKIGLLQPQAAPYVGRLEVVDIGIPASVYDSLGSRIQWVTGADIRPLFTRRGADTHKGTYGHVLLIGGSETKPGAILLAGKSALRTGAGLATVALPDRAFRKLPKNFLELMYEPLPSVRSGTFARKAWAKIARALEGKSAVAMGPGMGVNADTRELVRRMILKAGQPLVLDADALNCLGPVGARRAVPLRRNVILTPHPGEMARLTGLTTAKIQKDRLAAARDFAMKHGVIVVLKGFRTVTAAPSGDLFVNATGNPGMATAGMGDVLTGVIVSLLAQGLDAGKAAVAGVFLHGRAGDRVADRLGDRGLLASEVADEVPKAIQEMLPCKE
ncbi:MAG TPA: NAD(P)H-hydrate dehydratase [bacterium]|nr:NAD(P)H-hydrate dehydratase [bacterium]